MILENTFNVLERIAIALEKIANAPTLEPTKPKVEYQTKPKLEVDPDRGSLDPIDYTTASHQQIVDYIGQLESPTIDDIRQFQKSLRHLNRASGVIIIAKATNAVGAKRIDEIPEDRYPEFVLNALDLLANAK